MWCSLRAEGISGGSREQPRGEGVSSCARHARLGSISSTASLAVLTLPGDSGSEDRSNDVALAQSPKRTSAWIHREGGMAANRQTE